MTDESRLRSYLDAAVARYNTPDFIPADPVSIPHRFSLKQDVEIAGLFAATLAWGHRTMILRKASRLLEGMDGAPYQFISQHQETDLRRFLSFVHRTFNPTDLLHFIYFLRHHYEEHDSLETAFTDGEDYSDETVERALIQFHNAVFSFPEVPERTRKHVSTPARGSACKRLCMFLRWMVRNDDNGVDFGIWDTLKPHQLICPLDVHSSRVGRELGLLHRTATDWKAALELTSRLRGFDPVDPVKYDYALFGMGVEREW